MYPLNVGLVVETKEIWQELQQSLADAPVRVVFEQTEAGEWGEFLDKVDRLRPDVILIDIINAREPLEEIVRRIRGTAAAPKVFALHKTAEPETILRALRAGASEYLYPPFREHLGPALERVSNERAQAGQAARRGGKIIAFASAKGGCGATTIACHTAVSLGARTGQKVLIADLDMEAGMVGFLLKAQSRYSILDALSNVRRLDANYWSALITNGIPNLEILAAPTPPAAPGNAASEHLQYVLRFGRTQYDWVVLDLGRGLSPLSFGAIEESDETYVVTTLEVPALHHAKRFVEKLSASGYRENRLRLLLNRAPKRSDLTLDEIKTMIGIPVYVTIPNDYTTLHDCYSEGKLLPSSSELGRHFDRLAAQIAGVEAGKARRKFPFFG